MSKGDEGVAVHLTATVKSQNEIEFEGYAYVFGKEEDKWKAQKKLGLKDGNGKKMVLKESDWKTKFPKRGTTNDSSFVRKTDTDNDHYWCFLDTKGEKVQESGSGTTRNLWWKWNPSQHGFYQLKNWSSNLGVWWDHFFDKNKMDMAQLMESDPIGSWG